MDEEFQLYRQDGDFHETLRLLQEDETTNSTNSTTSDELTQTAIIRTTCLIYVSIFGALFLLFLAVRNFNPGVYNIKKSHPENAKLNNEIANDFYGPISWIWKIYNVDYDEICEQCGMDAATTIRILESGVKLSFVGVFNSAFLVPVYALLGDEVATSESGEEEDPVKNISLSNLEQGSVGAIATTIAAYILFGAAMYFIYEDFEWFVGHRHGFLKKRRIQNYSAYLSGLPKEMQTDEAVKEYFTDLYSKNSGSGGRGVSWVDGGEGVVADVHVALQIPNLEKKTAKRNALLPKYEHAMNVLAVKGTNPMHKTKMCGGEKVESIPTYREEIEELNDEISYGIEKVEWMQRKREEERKRGQLGTTDDNGDVEVGRQSRGEDPPEMQQEQEQGGSGLLSSDGYEDTMPSEVVQAWTGSSNDLQALPGSNDDDVQDFDDDYPPAERDVGNSNSEVRESSIAKLKRSITGLFEKEDGAPRDAVFVSFANLTYANLARQAVHDGGPWSCVPVEPPMPKLVNWKNVGKSNSSKQMGELMSLVLTSLLCIFWTIPVSFVASLSNVEALTEIFPFLQEPVDNYPWFSALLAFLAPLILVVFIGLLPVIILAIIKLEGLIEIETYQHPSMFSKLAAFTIIQTFFVVSA